MKAHKLQYIPKMTTITTYMIIVIYVVIAIIIVKMALRGIKRAFSLSGCHSFDVLDPFFFSFEKKQRQRVGGKKDGKKKITITHISGFVPILHSSFSKRLVFELPIFVY